MIRQLVISILLFSCLLNTTASKAPIPNPDCPTKCGDVSIPFPFGIREGCYVDEWFEVVCGNSSTSPRPILKRINLEVIGIDHNGTLGVRFPITFWNCGDGKTPQENLSLKGSPFAFAEDNNNFVAVGCDGHATIRSEIDQIVAGCSSVCTNNVLVHTLYPRCNGVSCCRTSIPSNLQVFNARFSITSCSDQNSETDCRYAFLVNETWFSYSVSNLSALSEMTDVPVVLNWGLDASKHGDSVNSTKSFPSSRYCNSISNTSIASLFSPPGQLVCYCKDGFEGNPYLDEGCLDVDECFTKGPNACESGRDCVNTIGNYTCIEPERKKSRVKVAFLGIGSGFGAVLLLLGSWGLFKLLKKRRKIQRKKKFFKRNGGLLLQQQLSSGDVTVEKMKLFNSKELEKATDRFNIDRILGQGGQGTVYKGMLADGQIVAIKKSKVDNEGKISEFINEVVILSQINHRNVVKLLGCCLETEVPLLVYEFVPNGTLSQYIYDEQEQFPLTWEIRLRIATEIAGALSYLHSSASLPIYHRDIKSTNILLDGKYRAKIADFGTSRSVAIDQTHLTTLVHGTFGYLDPEYFQSSQFTDKSDVYSFGVVLVELLTGQKPISIQRSEQDRSLATYFMQSIEENNLFDIVDARVTKEAKRDSIMEFAELAKQCLNLKGRKRPTMKDVVAMLEEIQKSEKASGAQEPNVEVECMIKVPDQPWDLFSTSAWSAASGEPAGPSGSSSDKLPLFSHITQ